jgi:hypothetical protein
MSSFEQQYNQALRAIMNWGDEVEVGEWQSQNVSQLPHMISRELAYRTFSFVIPPMIAQLQLEMKPNLPWAEDHFLERVSGQPLNPPPSEAWWPFKVRGNDDHKLDGTIFDHTYPERMWPKDAADNMDTNGLPMLGIRYYYGDLSDVVEQLVRNPLTRQAYLPIWFPEDTGAAGREGQRVPCTLGYHFMMRKGHLNVAYYMRSCDLLRHFADDAYMAGRLLQRVVGKLRERSLDIEAGTLIMYISSLHIFRGDYERVDLMIKEMEEEDEYGAPV